jgi:hypothetical protein
VTEDERKDVIVEAAQDSIGVYEAIHRAVYDASVTSRKLWRQLLLILVMGLLIEAAALWVAEVRHTRNIARVEQEGCRRRQPIFSDFASFVGTAKETREAESALYLQEVGVLPPQGVFLPLRKNLRKRALVDRQAAANYKRIISRVNLNIVRNCAKAYPEPHAWPW